MIVLGFDTTTRAGSVAVVRNGDVLYEAAGDPSITHGQRLPGDLMRALDTARVGIADVDLFAVAAGPGSFTGLRVGIATAQGLAMAHGRRVVAPSVLDVLALDVPGDRDGVGAWVDAHRGQVFAALYAGDRRRLLAGPTALTPRDTLDAWQEVLPASRIRFTGDGATRYAAAIVAAGGDASHVSAPPLLAPLIGRLAAAEPHRAVPPHAVVPVYIRRPDAELARARRSDAS